MPSRWRILVADDERAVRQLVAITLAGGDYEVLEAEDGVRALTVARDRHPHLALLDVNMPGLNGFDVCRLLRGDPRTASIRTIMLTGRRSAEDRRIAAAAGANGYFAKPFSPVQLLDRISSLLQGLEPVPSSEELSQGEAAERDSSEQSLFASGEMVARGQPPSMVEPSARGLAIGLHPEDLVPPDQLEQRQLILYAQDLSHAYRDLHSAYDATLEALVGALDVRDAQTEGHSLRVVQLAVSLGRRRGIAGRALEDLRRGAILHDVGKIGIPDAILRKPGPLSQPERAEMRRHPEYGRRILAPIPFLSRALDIVLCHHERWDGKGYPTGLSGTRIPLGARIFALADSWDAMTSDRPYRPAMPARAARDEIERCAGSQFDPELAPVFLELLAEPSSRLPA